MLSLNVKADLKQVERYLNDVRRKQLPFATAKALTNTAQEIKKAELVEMERVFDRPTRYTLGSLYVRYATKARLTATVWIKDDASNARPPIKWLAPQIEGGRRPLKGLEVLLQNNGRMPKGYHLVPAAGMQTDSFGNVSRGQLQRLISDLKSQPYDWTANTTKASAQRRLRSRTRRATFFFSTYPTNPKTAHLPPGIYVRTHFGYGTAIKPAFLFVHPGNYPKRLDFYGVANRVAAIEWPRQFQAAMNYALATAR